MVRNRLYCTQHIFVGKNEEEKKQKRKESLRGKRQEMLMKRLVRVRFVACRSTHLVARRASVWLLHSDRILNQLRTVQLCANGFCMPVGWAKWLRLADGGWWLSWVCLFFVHRCLRLPFQNFLIPILFIPVLLFVFSFDSYDKKYSSPRPSTYWRPFLSLISSSRKKRRGRKTNSFGVCQTFVVRVRRFLPLRLQPDFSQIFCFHHAQKTVLFSIQSVRRQFFLSPFSFSFLKQSDRRRSSINSARFLITTQSSKAFHGDKWGIKDWFLQFDLRTEYKHTYVI